MSKKYISFVLVLLLTTVQLFAQKGIPARPNPPKLVNNFSKAFPDFISQSEEAQLEQKLVDFANQTSNQIVIVIVDDLAGLEPSEFAYELGDKWKVGQEKQDNGIVILIKPTGGQGDRKYFIATGKGLEGAIPDATTRKIENEELLPNFKNGNFYKGLDATTDVLMALAKGEYNSDQYGERSNKKGGRSIFNAIIILVFIIIFVILGFKRKGGGGGGRGMTMGSRGIWLGTLGGFGAGRASGGGFGGGSSGGFGGFGGGGFGGGGSGGSW